MTSLAVQYKNERPGIQVTVHDHETFKGILMTHPPEIVRSLGNFIQNAMQHAKQDVTINLTPYGPKARMVHE